MAMLRLAEAEGITGMIATPHHANRRYDNEADEVRRSLALAQARIDAEGIGVKLYPGQEIRLYDGLIADLEAGKLQPLNDSRYLLIEFPTSRVPEEAGSLFHELRVLNRIPIIAHPERNAAILEKPDLLVDLVEDGALAQVTSHSLTGSFGRRIQQYAYLLCASSLVQLIASDAHHTVGRTPALQKAYDNLTKRYGETLTTLLQANAEAVIANKPVQRPEISRSSKKWYKFW
jgi:protein-tyrosine phosphatase